MIQVNSSSVSYQSFKKLLLTILTLFLLFCFNGCSQNENQTKVESIIDTENVNTEKLTEFLNSDIENGSRFSCLHDGWIYFSRSPYNTFGDAIEIGELYKMKKDGTEIMLLTEDAANNLTVIGEWLYYINNTDFRTLYRVKLDGSERSKIVDTHRFFSYIYIDGWIYFDEYLFKKGVGSDYYGSPGVYPAVAFSRIKPDGTQYQRLLDQEVQDFSYAPPYLYMSDASYNGVHEGGLIRINTDQFKKANIESNTIQFEVVTDFSVSGGSAVSEENKYYHATFTADSGYIVEEDMNTGEIKNLIKLENNFDTFNIKDGIFYYAIRVSNNEKIQIIRQSKYQKDILAEFESDRNIRMNIVGDWILYNVFENKYALSLDGKKHIQLTKSYETIGDEDMEKARDMLAAMENSLANLEEQGFYDGETLNFLALEALTYKYEISKFGLYSTDLIYYTINDLFKMSDDAIKKLNIKIQDIKVLYTYLTYFESVVENRPRWEALKQGDLEEATAILTYIKNFMTRMEEKEYLYVDAFSETNIDLRNIDESILFNAHFYETAFTPMLDERLPNMIPVKEIKVLNELGKSFDIVTLSKVSSGEIMDLGIKMEDLVKLQSDITYIEEVIKTYEGK